jgi:predicted amidohydrolase
MRRFRVAAAQPKTDKDDSLIFRDVKRYIRLAKEKGADLVCFPEASIVEAPKRNRELISEVAEECRKRGIWCLITARLREGKRIYNTSVLIDDGGLVAGKHRKVHLLGDSRIVSPGSAFEIYETRLCNIGIAICWDVSDPSAISAMARSGADVIFCPMYWAFDEWAHRKDHKLFEKRIMQSLILARAYDNLVYVVFASQYDRANPENTPYTAIAEPHRIMKEMFDREGMIVADLDLDYLRRIRKRYSREYGKRIPVC